MATTIILAIALIYALCTLAYRYLVYPTFVSPLSKIPSAHPTASLSSAWILWKRWVGKENVTIHEAHERLGSLVRLGPNEISVNCMEGGVRTVYTGGYEKDDWYSNSFANYDGVHNMFSTEKRGIHSARKRILSNIYAKSVLHASPALAEINETVLCQRMLPVISTAPQGTLEVYELFSAVMLDLMTAYVFGLELGTNVTEDAEAGREYIHDFKSRQPYLFWPQEMPTVFHLFSKLGLSQVLIPAWVDHKAKGIEGDCLRWCDAAEDMFLSGRIAKSPGNCPSVYNHMRNGIKKKEKEVVACGTQSERVTQQQRMDMASELLDDLTAGFDTAGTTLTYLAWEISRPHNLAMQKALQEELRSLNPSMIMDSKTRAEALFPDAKIIDELPLLHAVIMETLRLHAAVPGKQPRVTPPNATLGPPGAQVHGIPAGVRVSSTAYSLHRNRGAFPEPEEWRPERWLSSIDHVDDSGEKELSRWFWAFGSGGRMCVGNNLAMTEMKHIVAAIWSNFSTTIVNDDGMEHVDGYFGQPRGSSKGNCFRLRFERLGPEAS